jgi:ubiquinone/menaquinone biosynthesis C-methylase UbiE
MGIIASFTKDGLPIEKNFQEAPDLEYCFDAPTNWNQVIYSPMDIHFSGWAISLDNSPVTITITGDHPQPRTTHPDIYRPDVKEYMKKLGKQVNDRCGFEFTLSLNEVPDCEKKFKIEITNDKYSSGPNVFFVSPFRSVHWPRLLEKKQNLLSQKRSDYKSTWNALLQTVGVNKDDIVLEIGCGIARMASVLAPICKKWIGTDVSENMLEFARKRTGLYTNVECIPINGWDLNPIPDQSIDLVYCTVVFMHIDEWERYNYVCEARRVLRSGGRLYVDNFNLRSNEGWKVFMDNFLAFHPMERPSHISKSSTPDELKVYFQRAGFEKINQSESDTWIRTWGVKP